MSKKKLAILAALSLILSLCCTFSVITAGASPNDYGSRGYGKHKYYGKIIDMRNVSTYSMTINQDCFTKDKPFLEFINTPEKTGSRSEYTPDYEKLVITLTDGKNPSNQLRIQCFPRGDGNAHSICISAGATGQNMLGEYFATKVDQPDELSVDYPAMIPYTFDGYTREQRYINKNNKKIGFGVNDKISLYYDKELNTVYTDAGLDNVKSKINIAENGSNLWKIRDLSKTDYLIKKSNTQKVPCLDKAWNGFTADAEIKVTFSMENIGLGKKPSIMLFSLGGQPLYKHINVESQSQAVKGCTYMPPVPSYYDYENLKDVDFVGGQYKVISPSGKEIVPVTDFKNVKPFITDEEGNYEIHYFKDDEESLLDVNCLPEGTKGSVILPATEKGVFYQGNKLNIGADVLNDLQSIKPVVNLKIRYNDEIIKEVEDISQSYEFQFKDFGNYDLIYSSCDYVGRNTEKIITLNFARYFPVFRDGITDGQCFNDASEVMVSPEDLQIFDIPLQKCFVPSGFKITVSYNGNDFVPLDEVDFSNEGKYEIVYKAKYSSDKVYDVEVNRTFYVYRVDESEIKISDKQEMQPTNTKFQGKENGCYVYNGLMSKKISFPANFASVDGNRNIIAEFQHNGIKKDITDDFRSGIFSFIPEENEYSVMLKTDRNKFSPYVIIRFNIRNEWLEAEKIEDMKINIGMPVPDLYPVIKDFYGNVITDDNIELKVSCCGKNIPLNEFKIDKFAVYNVKYVCRYNGEILEGCYNIVSTDITAPSISLKDHDENVLQYDFVKIAGIVIADNSGLICSKEVSVTKDGKNIMIYNNGFKAEELGEYQVSYIVTDVVGNQSEESYIVNVKANPGGKGGCGQSCNGLIWGISIPVAVLVIAAVVVSIIIFKKRKK